MERKRTTLLTGLIIGILVYAAFVSITLDYHYMQKSRRSELRELQRENRIFEQKLQSLEQELQLLGQELQVSERELQGLGQQLQEMTKQGPQKLEKKSREEAEEIWENAWLTIGLPLPREVHQAGYFQIIENLTLNCEVRPSGTFYLTDELENLFIIYWNEEQNSEIIVVSLETIVFREVNTDILNDTSPHPYPISENLIPDDVRQWLEPTDDPKISALAKELAEGLNDETEVVAKTVLWVNQNIKYKSLEEICKEYQDIMITRYGKGNYGWKAAEVLEYRVGVCCHFAELTIALLRAQGIPARLAGGFIIPDYFGVLQKLSLGHTWVQVYYPKAGWINYDPTVYAEIHLPHHIEFNPGALMEGDAKLVWELSAISLGDGRSKIIRTVTVFPKESEA